jgi:hypothetical protein
MLDLNKADKQTDDDDWDPLNNPQESVNKLPLFDLNKADKQTDHADDYQTSHTPQDPIQAFTDEMARHGFDPGGIIPDREIHKFSTKEGDPKDQAGWYVYFPGDVCGATFADWRTGFKRNWCSV